MKHYLKRLRNAIRNKNYYPYYHEDDYPLVWELDYYIVNMVRVNLRNYNSGHPVNYTEEEREKIKLRLIELADKICEGAKIRYKFGQFESKVGYSNEDIAEAEAEFAKLLGKNLRYLRD